MTQIFYYAIAGIVSALGALCLLALTWLPSLRAFVVIGLVWLGIVAVAHDILRRVGHRSQDQLLLTVTTVVSFLGLATLIEWRPLFLLLMLLVGCAMWVVHIPSGLGRENITMHKPLRRIFMMLWVFDTYALATTAFALPIAFSTLPFWILAIVMGSIFAGAAFMIWRLYFTFSLQRGSVWLLIVALLMIEFIWVFHLLPFGYLVSGLLVTWVWYILQLMLRFHLSPQGIVWSRQRWFLIGNIALYLAVLLFLVRWV